MDGPLKSLRRYYCKMTTTRFCLVRHGETDWNVQHRLQGHIDISLNSHGLAQAEKMAKALKHIQLEFDVLYTSDLQRAEQTANAIERLYEVKAIRNTALRERHLGALQGLITTEALAQEPELWRSHVNRDLDQDLRGGESILQFAHRIQSALEELQQKHLGQTVLLVSHGGALDMMYRLTSGQGLETEKLVAVPNASLNWISHDGYSWKVDSWADTSHLEGLSLDNLDL